MTDKPTATEITITLKGSESTFKKKYLEYQAYTMQPDDPLLVELVTDAKSECKFEVEEVKVRASF